MGVLHLALSLSFFIYVLIPGFSRREKKKVNRRPGGVSVCRRRLRLRCCFPTYFAFTLRISRLPGGLWTYG